MVYKLAVLDQVGSLLKIHKSHLHVTIDIAAMFCEASQTALLSFQIPFESQIGYQIFCFLVYCTLTCVLFSGIFYVLRSSLFIAFTFFGIRTEVGTCYPPGFSPELYMFLNKSSNRSIWFSNVIL